MRCLQDTLNMIGVNLFRTLPDLSSLVHSGGGGDDDDNEVFSDPEWPHISLVYELLIHLVLSSQIDNNLRKRLIDDTFLRHLIALFNSMDQRERECLKTVTHRIYGKLTNRRVTIRKTINYVFYQFLYENKEHNGIAELLEILASIINGFTVPIRPEHKESLRRSLIPLHKTRSYETYSIQLSYCMTLYVAKDPSLSQPVGLSRSSHADHHRAPQVLALRKHLQGDLVPLRARGPHGAAQARGHRALPRAALQAHRQVHR